MWRCEKMTALKDPLTYLHYAVLALALMFFHFYIGMGIIVMQYTVGFWPMVIIYFAAFTFVLAAVDILWHKYVSD